MRDEIEVAGREIILFVVARIVGDVHLAILAGDFPVRIDDDRGVMVDALGALLEQRRDDNDFARRRDLA